MTLSPTDASPKLVAWIVISVDPRGPSGSQYGHGPVPAGAPALGNKLRGFFRIFIFYVVLLLLPDLRAGVDQFNATHVLALCGLLPSRGCLAIVQVPFCSTKPSLGLCRSSWTSSWTRDDPIRNGAWYA